jgi:hypothetical protein
MAAITLAQCVREIIELHDFFQSWFTGALPETEATFQRFATVTDKGFCIIGPHGRLTGLESLTTGLRHAYGKQPGLRIWTQNHTLRQQHDDVALCTYEEWQETADATTARLSSVLFRRSTAAPNGVVWLHVHETWIA